MGNNMYLLQTPVRKKILIAGLLALPLVLSGCVGSSTYGTGKTSGEHLIDGLGGVLGSTEKKKPIKYMPRPDLVQPPKQAALPAPVENGASTSELPEDPELRRARLRAEAPQADERSGNLPIEFLKRKRSPDSKTQRVAATPYVHDEVIDPNYDPKRSRARLLKYKAEIAGASGSNKRKYLTEPPREYRTPADTAPKGEIGIDEKIKARKANGKKSFSWRDLNPFS